jgi:hypothetical protein
MLRAAERMRERAEVRLRAHRRLLAADRRAAALAEAKRLHWPSLRIGARSQPGIRVKGEAAWRALLEDAGTDIAAVWVALANFRTLTETAYISSTKRVDIIEAAAPPPAKAQGQSRKITP